MIWSTVDLLASEYGWRKSDILEGICLDEVLQLQDRIEKRKIAKFRMLLLVQHHSKPNELLAEFDEALKEEEIPGEKLDKEGFAKLKDMMAFGKQFNIK